MRYQLLYKPYLRKLNRPVRFGDICVVERSGVIVRLTDSEGRIGYGEIAPLESFGSESVEKSLKLLKSFCGVISRESIYQVDENEYPCTGYALLQAMKEAETATQKSVVSGNHEWIPTSKLLQNDCMDHSTPSLLREVDIKVVKLKIAGENADLTDERMQVEKVIQFCSRRGLTVRLDANEKLSFDESRRWLELLSHYPETVEFLEQPMDRWMLEEMMELVSEFQVPIALDESIGILRGQSDPLYLEKFFYVLKPSLGDLNFARWNEIGAERIILSSVFETAIGFSDLLNFPFFKWVPGLDTQSVFEDRLVYPGSSTGFQRGQIEKERLWNLLG